MDLTINTIYSLVDSHLRRWTPEQWQAVQAYEEFQTYEEAAKRLGIRKQNVHKRCSSAHWGVIRGAEETLSILFSDYADVHRLDSEMPCVTV